jgi:hypothetical protein
MGNTCIRSGTAGKTSPVINHTEVVWSPYRKRVVRISNKVVYYSDPQFSLRAVDIEAKAKNLLMAKMMQQIRPVVVSFDNEEDEKMIQEISRELLRAKAAMDESMLTDDLGTSASAEAFSIVPYADIEHVRSRDKN